MNVKKKAGHLQRRLECLSGVLSNYKRDLAERLSKTKEIFKKKVYAVDIHTHSTFSDGLGTVQENYKAAMNCGLDFLFATDHNSLGQKRMVKKWSNASWGQEPGAGSHHIGLLHPRKLFTPKAKDIVTNFENAKSIAPFVWIPHPVGYYDNTWYSDEWIETLWTLGNSFAIEVINGAGKIATAYDVFDEKAVSVWDKLLCDGRRVTALGGSDAHGSDEIGTVWTGVYAAKCEAKSIIKALNNGHSFASEAPLLWLSCGQHIMGDEICRKRGTKIKINFACCDSLGLHSVRLIKNGEVIKNIKAKDVPMILDSYQYTVEQKSSYFRLECTAIDQRRAFSSPIYIKSSIS
ncbi:CehA/McbA family metallohydrolase [bacterium]|nr:CehA/McbA family metallohydrolase [bacterium]